MILLKFVGISKYFTQGPNKIWALKNINLEIEEGGFIAVTGTSGAGKTTFLEIVGCLLTPSSGKYFFKQKDISLYNDKELSLFRSRTFGFIFQNFNLLPRLTAIENIVLPMRYAKINKKSAYSRALELLDYVGVLHRKNHLPSQLSGGECQRVAIARALANNPKILLADEPTGNLDSYNTEVVMNILSTLHQEGKTIILTTHEPKLALKAQVQVILQDGKIIEINRR